MQRNSPKVLATWHCEEGVSGIEERGGEVCTISTGFLMLSAADQRRQRCIIQGVEAQDHLLAFIPGKLNFHSIIYAGAKASNAGASTEC